MVFSWKEAKKRAIRHLKYRKEVMKKNGKQSKVIELDKRIKDAEAS